MALIYADDFQQLATATQSGLTSMFQVTNSTLASTWVNVWEALGYSTFVFGVSGVNRSHPVAYYSGVGALGISADFSSGWSYPNGTVGFRRSISYEGSTLFIGLCIAQYPNREMKGNFVQFPGTNYALGINSSGFYTFNGVATTVAAYYGDAVVKNYFDIVINPAYCELWINNVRHVRIDQAGPKPTEIYLTHFDMTYLAYDSKASSGMYLYSLGWADDTAGFAQRFGRRMVKTEKVATVALNETPLVASGSTDVATVLGRYADDPTAETAGYMYGSLAGPVPYQKNDFTGVRSSIRKPVAALANFQSKRLYPAADGMGLLPYITIGGTKVYGNKIVPSSRWKTISSEIPIAAGQTFANFNFGYESDYKDPNRVYVVDRDQTEVYGNPPLVATEWYKSSDLIAFDSTIYNSAGFKDFNGKTLNPITATLPYLAGTGFKYGQGIHMNGDGAISLGAGAIPADTLTKAWTLDFWAVETVDNAIHSLWPVTYWTGGGVTDRLLIGVHDQTTTRFALWNNAANARVISTWTAPLSSTNWRHWAFVYDGVGTTSVYLDGALVGTMAWTILQSTSLLAIGGRSTGTAARAIIERYRLRSGAAWTAAFDLNQIYN